MGFIPPSAVSFSSGCTIWCKLTGGALALSWMKHSFHRALTHSPRSLKIAQSSYVYRNCISNPGWPSRGRGVSERLPLVCGEILSGRILGCFLSSPNNDIELWPYLGCGVLYWPMGAWCYVPGDSDVWKARIGDSPGTWGYGRLGGVCIGLWGIVHTYSRDCFSIFACCLNLPFYPTCIFAKWSISEMLTVTVS